MKLLLIILIVMSCSEKKARTVDGDYEPLEKNFFERLKDDEPEWSYDLDNDGLRDDVERFINRINVTSRVRKNLKHLYRVRTLVLKAASAGDEKLMFEIMKRSDKLSGCINALYGESQKGYHVMKRVEELFLDHETYELGQRAVDTYSDGKLFTASGQSLDFCRF